MKKKLFIQNPQYRIDHFHNNQIPDSGIHKHDFYELFFFISGTAYYIINNKKTRIAPGSILLINRNTFHTPIVKPDGNKKYNRYVLSISVDLMDSLCTEITDLRQCFYSNPMNVILLTPDPASNKTILTLLKQLLEISSIHGYGYDVRRKIYIAQLLLVINDISLNLTSHLTSDHVVHSLLADSICDYIRQNFHHNLSLDDIAEHFFISKSHLCHHFKKKVGITVNQFILEQRIEYAKVLISRGQTITEVSKQCGFNDPSTLYRSFKKYTGISPSQYLT